MRTGKILVPARGYTSCVTSASPHLGLHRPIWNRGGDETEAYYSVLSQNTMLKKYLIPSALPPRKRTNDANPSPLASIMTCFYKMREMVITNGRIWMIS